MQCRKVAGMRRQPHDVVLARVVARKRKVILSDSVGNKSFVLAAQKMLCRRNGAKISSMDGGDIVKEFAVARKPRIEKESAQS